ncbi:MAG: formate dehydrogenase accessory protein FdhE [bacterium]
MDESRTVVKRIDKISQKLPLLGEVISFGYDMWQIQNGMRDAVNIPSLLIMKADRERYEKRIKENLPLLDKQDILVTLHMSQWMENAHRVMQFLRERRPQLIESIEEIEKHIQGTDAKKLIEPYLPPLDSTPYHGVMHQENNDALMFYVLDCSLKPSARTYGKICADFFSKMDPNDWKLSICPLCGGKPMMGEIKGEEGKKYLICSWCETVWLYRRVECPFCQNSAHDSLKYFSSTDLEIEEDLRLRVDMCEKCKKYLKTIDNKEDIFENKAFGLEDLLTLYLDLIAHKEGFERPIPQSLISR